jgi:hypothetical protein
MKAQPLLPAPLKRRRGPRVAVLALVLCSLLVPLAFLFDRAPSGTYPTLPYPSSLACALGWDSGARGPPRSDHRVSAGGSGAPAPSSGYRAPVLINLRLSPFRDCFSVWLTLRWVCAMQGT